MTLDAGTKFGRYEIRSQVGAGGMGEVYLAQDTGLDRKVALKILPPALADDNDRMSRFVREAKLASALNHPNIITIHEIGEVDGVHFIATEYIEGETLTAQLQRELPSLKSTIDIALQVASALDAAHQAGIVHRDIKPDNIMVRQDGIVKVLDFGLVKLTATDSSKVDREAETKIQIKTNVGIIMGTVAYMSPEQARGQDTDARTDIWSFGCVLYEMLTHQQPFPGETMVDVWANIIYQEPASILAHRSDTPVELERIVARSLRKERDERYQSAKELFNDLQQLQTRLLVESEIIRTGSGERISQIQPSPFLNSIAVLPFTNLSAEKDNEYFSEGLTEEIIMNLSKLQRLKVIASGSTMHYVKEGKTHKQTASDLGVQYLLEGSVRRQGRDLRITAQLIDALRDVYVWSETYRGTIAEIFDIQEKVAVEIVQALQLRVSPDEKQNLKKRFTENTGAYQFYLQGRFFWNKRSEQGLKTAIKYFEQAIENDPRYALAWAGIADSYSLLGEFGNIPRKELYPKARAAVNKALEIDNRLAEVHTSLASILMLSEWDWVNSAREFKLALELNPNYATAHHWYSTWFLNMGRLEECLRMISRAADLDPVSQAILKDKGLALYYNRQYDEAIEMARTTLELDPNYAAAHRLLSLAYQGKKEFDEAIAENQKWGKLTGNKVETAVTLAQLYAVSGQVEEAKRLMDDVKRNKLLTEQIHRGLALVHAALGEIDVAFKYLEESYEQREEAILSLKVDPKADPLRSDPRFLALLKKIGVEK
ncbi:MAG TPA: protein kinase [Pyrinomonadaceae bacterium]|jgi:serine/threonine-protein kinase|nr:protein kinase [Pyrinomonadaceae bacterium]